MDKIEISVSGSDTTRPWQSYHTVYTNAKAGMEGVDKERVQRIVYEMSKGSKYFENEEKKEAYMKQKIENMRAQCAKLTASDLTHYQEIADKRIIELEATRDLSRIWLHVDMDAFYAACETLCNPSLEGKPMAVGGLSMISTANYEARKFGVRAAMPGFIARKLCPELIFVPVDFKKYTYYSGLTRKVFRKYDPNFLAASLDEAYLDITNFCNDKGMTAGEVAEELRESVHSETGLTCSAGVAPNRLLAKVCSDINKPNGQFLLPNERMAVMTFISSLPIRKIGGIGKVTENILKDVFGITTCEEMLKKSNSIFALFSRSSADFFLSVGLGLGRTDTPELTLRKSMSNERTFSSTEDQAALCEKLVDLAEYLSADLKKEGLCGKTLTLKLKTSGFEVRTRAVTLPNYISSSEDLLKHAMKLLKTEFPVSLRLMGLRMSHLSEGKNGSPVDPKQKTLTNFIVTEDSNSGRGPGNEIISESDINDDNIYIDKDASFSTDTTGVYESIRENFDDRVDYWNHNVEESSPDRRKRARNCSRDEAGPSRNEPMIWLNNYICSVCGIEVPLSFVEERQEHFDFHLAEKLQEQESSNVHRNLEPRQRLVEKDQKASDTKKKKQKKQKQKASPSDGNYIPIDMFFSKTSQNF